MQPKFYSDENVPLAVSKALRKRGIDILAAKESGMLHQDDNTQLSFAISEKRAVITHDSDFLNLIAKETHYGILFFTRQVKIGQAIEEIEKVHLAYTAEELKGIILFLPQ